MVTSSFHQDARTIDRPLELQRAAEYVPSIAPFTGLCMMPGHGIGLSRWETNLCYKKLLRLPPTQGARENGVLLMTAETTDQKVFIDISPAHREPVIYLK